MMKTTMFLACILAVVAGCKGFHNTGMPAEAKLRAAASANGKYTVTVERYNAKEKIATVRTPGWQPESKPYQFDGKEWIPLWSPYLAPETETK